MITIFGSIGIGMVCGWLTGMLFGSGNCTLRNILVLIAANVIIGIVIYFMIDWLAMLFFLGSGAVIFLSHLILRYALKNYF